MKNYKLLGLAAGLIALLILPLVVKDEYYLHILILTGINILLVSGINIVQGYSGRVSLGHQAFLGIGAYTSALFYLRLHTPWWLDLILAGVVAAAAGWIIGTITLRLRGPYFVIMTLAFSQAIGLIALNWVSFTRGAMGLGDIGVPEITIPGLVSVNFQSKAPFYYLILFLAGLAVYIMYRFANSRVGRAALAIRENQDLAESVGVNTTHYLITPFVIATFLAGLAGGFYAHYVTYINPDLFHFSWMVSMLIMLISGGPGTIVGPLIGSLIFTVLPEWLRFTQLLRLPIFGLMLMAVVIFLPRGIYPSLKQGFSLLVRRSRKSRRVASRESASAQPDPSGPGPDYGRKP